ncbi:MAG TPA: glycosyltransferase family 9 protein [Candidatus Hydrogenedentes bacterium]|nr:glycosyltransferase family 9 protein [Candidatus Hydrogenedentota bacterium]
MRTLIVHTGGIGDFLLTCPAIAWLAQEGPIELLGYPERLGLAVEGGLAERAHSLDQAGFSSVFSSPSERLRRFLTPFQRAIVWMRDTGEINAALQACGLEDIRCFPGVPPEDWEQHASAYYLRCIGGPEVFDWKLEIRPIRPIRPILQSTIVIHPGSGGKQKNWPLEHFKIVAESLLQRKHPVQWCVGPAEENWEVPPGPERLHASSLVELAHILQRTALYIGNDSGITHLAAAVGCRTVAIFGPTNPKVWGPRGTHVRIVQGNPWPAPRMVLDSIHSLL